MAAEWARRGSCRGMEPAIFFPTDEDDHATARAVCARCPVRQSCLDAALRNKERHGIWGGLNTAERDSLGKKAPRRRGPGRGTPRGPVSIAQVVAVSAEFYGVTVGAFLAQRGSPSLVEARNATMAAVRQVTGASFPVIARHFGRRHHDTVMIACRSVLANDRLAKRVKYLAAKARASASAEEVAG